MARPPEAVARGAQRLREPECASGAGERVLQLGEARRIHGRFALNRRSASAASSTPRGTRLERVQPDFGQTLGKFGMGPGFYLVLPLLGPRTARDAVGAAVDLFLRLDTWLLPLQGQLFLGGGFGISERDNRREELRALREGSIDFYAAVRSAYLQTREARVREARDP
jgi:phospholipid-binding lipoprotein MlaA